MTRFNDDDEDVRSWLSRQEFPKMLNHRIRTVVRYETREGGTVGDLRRKVAEREFMRVPNFGRKSNNVLRAALGLPIISQEDKVMDAIVRLLRPLKRDVTEAQVREVVKDGIERLRSFRR
jgi:hypothetical protein